MLTHLLCRLGSYSDRDEFQVGRVIVWVEIPAHGDGVSWLERADRLFEEIWAAIPAVLSAAKQKSRVMAPEYWKAKDDARILGEQLEVAGIWIEPVTGSADYEVFIDQDFDFKGPPGLPKLPDGHTVMVRRDSGGRLAIVNAF